MSLGENMENEVLHATHEGKLVLDNTTIDVAVLNNGQRIITQAGVFKALDRPQYPCDRNTYFYGCKKPSTIDIKGFKGCDQQN